MERRGHHLIAPLLLLLGLLAGAAAITGADAQPCEPNTLATQVVLRCASGLPTAPCCETVVASVDRGGGVPCLCRVAAQPEAILVSLNATRLASLYVACGGRMYTEGARFAAAAAAAACLGSPPLAIPVVVSPPVVALREGSPPLTIPVIPSAPAVPLRDQQSRFSCNSTVLAIELTQSCRYDMKVPSLICCRSVLMTIDDQDKDCLCRVTETGPMVVSDYLDVRVMWDLYKQCGGRQQAIPKDVDNCAHTPSPPPSPSPPPPPSPPQLAPPPPVPQLAGWEVAVIVVVIVVVVGALVEAGRRIWKKIQQRKAEKQAQKRQLELELQRQQEESEREQARQAEQRRQEEERRERALERELDQDIGLLPKRVLQPPQEKEKIRVRVQYHSDTAFHREAQFN